MAILWTATSTNTWKEHTDFMRTTGGVGQWGASGCLHLKAGGRNQGGNSRHSHYTGPIESGFWHNLRDVRLQSSTPHMLSVHSLAGTRSLEASGPTFEVRTRISHQWLTCGGALEVSVVCSNAFSHYYYFFFLLSLLSGTVHICSQEGRCL